MKTILASLFAAAVLAGCSSDYILSTNTGAMIESTSKPYLNERTGMYEYRTKEARLIRGAGGGSWALGARPSVTRLRLAEPAAGPRAGASRCARAWRRRGVRA
jgi:hypothetical protein